MERRCQHELTECSKLNLKQRSMVKLNMYKNERSIMRQFRSGVLPLIIETGRLIGEALNQRLRRFCYTDAVEDEKHFLFESALYNTLRNRHSADIFIHDHSDTLDDNLAYAMTTHPRMLPKFLVQADLLRRKYLYKLNNNVNYTYNVLYICNVNFSTIFDTIIVLLKYLRLFLPIFYVHNRIVN